MANYSEIRSIVTNAKNMLSNIGAELGKAIAQYVSSATSITETDVYNMVKELPQDIQIQALCKALAEVNRKTSSARPSYIQNTNKPGRKGLI